MSALVKLAKVESDNLHALRKFYDDVESKVWSLRNLGIDSKSYGSLLSTLIIEKLPQDIKLIIHRKKETNIWGFTKVLDLISLELWARETCVVPNQLSPSMDGKNEIVDDLFIGSSLHVAGNSRSWRGSNAVKCVFCKGFHWLDKCRVIADPEARKEFLKKGKRCFLCLNVDHVGRNCTKSKSCFYCKGMHNSAICHNKKDKWGKSVTIDSSTNYASNFYSALLPTTEILLENPLKKHEVPITALFNQSLQRTYVTQRVKRMLQLASICAERISISTFGNKKCKFKNLERVSVHLKNSKEKFEVEVLCTPFICLPIQRQSSNFPKQNFDYLKELELHNSKLKNDIDLLLGSDFYWLLVTGNVKFGNPGEPVRVETKFGWVLNGPLKGEDVNGLSNTNFVVTFYSLIQTKSLNL